MWDCVRVHVCIVCVCSCKWPKGKQRDGEMEAQKEKKPTEQWASVNTDKESEGVKEARRWKQVTDGKDREQEQKEK